MKRYIWLFISIAVFVVMQLMGSCGSISECAWNMLCVVAVMAILWISETIELGVTALLPIVLFPLLGIMKFEDVTLQYANETIFLFLGGFMLAIALEKSNIHERFALQCIKLIGGSPIRILFGFMFVIFFLSMWVSNTAAVLMVIPICTAVVNELKSQAAPEEESDINKFSKALYLSLAYAASIGGVGTIIGTPPNTVLVSIINNSTSCHISFLQWMVFAAPMALILLLITWLFLSYFVMSKKTRNMHINTEKIIEDIRKLGPMRTHEKRAGIVFLCVVFLWIFKDSISIDIFNKISDTTIAIAGTIVLFFIPCGGVRKDRLLEWEDSEKIPWNVLLLFGGGLALSKGFSLSGLSTLVANMVNGANGINPILFILLISLVTAALTELMSNTATATLLIPISISIAAGLNVSPYLIAIPVAISSSFAFMLPISTPPNAIVFSYGFISIKEMLRVGTVINLIALILIAFYGYYLIPVIFG